LFQQALEERLDLAEARVVSGPRARSRLDGLGAQRLTLLERLGDAGHRPLRLGGGLTQRTEARADALRLAGPPADRELEALRVAERRDACLLARALFRRVVERGRGLLGAALDALDVGDRLHDGARDLLARLDPLSPLVGLVERARRDLRSG